MSEIGLFGALLLGAAFGYGARRGGFCMNSGFREALAGDWTKVKALVLAIAVQLLTLPVIFGMGLASPAALALKPLAALLGGLLFGASMHWAGGCAAGVWYKLGAGDVGALLAVLGMALGATAADSGPLLAFRASLQNALPTVAAWKPPLAVSIATGLLLLATLGRRADGRAGAWSWRKTGLLIGGVAALAWPVSAATGRNFGLAIVPGTTGLLAALEGHSFPTWDALLVTGVLIGGWLAVRRDGPVALSSPNPATSFKRFAGGLGLGIGASIATGCTVGQGLTGLALLAPSSVVVMGAIFGGRTFATLAARRLAAFRPSVSSTASP